MATDTSSDLGDLAKLGAALAEVAGNAEKKTRVIDMIMDKIGSLDKETAKLLVQDERIQNLLEVVSSEKAQSANDPPGTIYDGFIGQTKVKGFVKKPWSERDLAADREGAGKLVSIVPSETILVFWNGLRRQFIADEEMVVEKCFVDIYNEHRRNTKLGSDHAAYLFKKRDTMSDWSMLTREGAKVRGMGDTGWYVAGGGSIITREVPAAAEGAGGTEATPPAEGAEGK